MSMALTYRPTAEWPQRSKVTSVYSVDTSKLMRVQVHQRGLPPRPDAACYPAT